MPADLTPAEIEAMRLRASGEPPWSALPPHTPLEDDLSADVMRLLAVVDALTARLAEAEANGRRKGLEEARRIAADLSAAYREKHGGGGDYCAALSALTMALAAKVTPFLLPCPTCGYNGVPGTTHSTSCLYPEAKVTP